MSDTPEHRKATDEEEAVTFDEFPDEEEGEVPEAGPEERTFDDEPDD